jgi:hypothetical protein
LGAQFGGYQPRPSIHLALAPAPTPCPMGLTRGRILIRPDHALGAIAITLETREGPIEMTLARDAAVRTIVAMPSARWGRDKAAAERSLIALRHGPGRN